MPRILVNYRRDDSAAYAGRIADRLKEQFGRDNVFVDIDTIRPGEDFVDRIDQSIASCDVLVAVIGRSWLTAADPQGRRRLDRDDDFVRMEIAKALERHVRVIPALVGDAAMPEAAQLPQNLVALSRRQAIEISDNRFHHDVGQLIEVLAGAPVVPTQPTHSAQPTQARHEPGEQPAGKPFPSTLVLGGAVAVAVLAFAVWLSLSNGTSSSEGGGGERTATTSSPGGTPGTPSGSGAAAASTRSPAAGSVGNGAPGETLPAPAVAPAASGKTGIQIVWRGTTSVPCTLFDETGTKALSPQGFSTQWYCAPEMGLWDAAPGKYQIQFGGVAETMPPFPIVVTRNQVLRVEPPVGQLRFRWNGSNSVSWFLLDQSGEKTLSPTGFSTTWTCDPGKVCARDLGPGTYLVKVDAPGYQPVRVTMAAFRATDVTIP